MAYIIYRKINEPSRKKNWIPINRKYKWMFYTSLVINCILAGVIIYGQL